MNLGRAPWATAGVAAALIAVSVVATQPRIRTEIVGRTGDRNAPGASTSAGPAGSGGGSGFRSGTGSTGGVALECAAGGNGGATDVGVTATSIKLGATVVESGIGRAFLADVRHGMTAVAARVNASGGICGRRLELDLRDDGWDANTGFRFIQNLVEDTKVFALAVVPSSEGLRAADSYVRSKGVPVIGADGMLVGQYTNPYVWPVAASTITAMHIMALNAHARGSSNFGIVYDSNYRFGVEGAYAFNAAVRRLTGKNIPGYTNPLSGSAQCRDRFCGIRAGDPSYGSDIEVFRRACGSGTPCDYVVYLLEPDTAQKWMAQGGPTVDDVTQNTAEGRAKGGIGAPQPLFNRSFGVNCGEYCHNLWVWTSYTPAIASFADDPSVASYVDDLRRANPEADANNSFVEGGYVGMELVVAALRRLGPEVTRPGLIATLNSMSLDTGLTRPLAWTAGSHFANRCMMGFSIQSRPSFAGWRQETGWVCDPWAGEDLPPG